MLYICATPIGNLEDVTIRVLKVLGSADLIACEDTRHTRILLKRHGIKSQVVSFHEHNEEKRIATLLPLLREGKDVAVVSDAGMPGVCDPGFTLVRACAAEGLPVTVLPGPSAVSTALVMAGLPSDRFAFVGFLARNQSKLLEQLSAFEGTRATVVAFESPQRVRSSLGVIAGRWPERQVAVCRELTKMHEEVIRGTGAEVLEMLAEKVKGEVVLVLEPSSGEVAPGAVVEASAIEGALKELVRAGIGVKRAAGVASALTGRPQRELYRRALELKQASNE